METHGSVRSILTNGWVSEESSRYLPPTATLRSSGFLDSHAVRMAQSSYIGSCNSGVRNDVLFELHPVTLLCFPWQYLRSVDTYCSG
jgi:hypothetical protein